MCQTTRENENGVTGFQVEIRTHEVVKFVSICCIPET